MCKTGTQFVVETLIAVGDHKLASEVTDNLPEGHDKKAALAILAATALKLLLGLR